MSGPAAPGRRRLAQRSLAGRVTLLTTIAVALAVTLLAAGAYVTARTQLQQQLDESLTERARLAAESGGLAFVAQEFNLSSQSLGASDVRISFLRNDGVFQPTDPDVDLEFGEPELAVARGESDESIRTIGTGDGSYRVVAVPTSQEGVALIMAQSTEEQERLLRRIGLVCLIVGIVGVLGSGLAGWLVARNGLRPVRRLTTSVERITRTEDLTPLSVEGSDEIARLATAFNQMLTALDASRDRQRRLVTDAGHELRTPLTSLRTNIDLLTQADVTDRDLAPGMRAELLADISEQIGELTTLIGDLTELARDEPLAPVVGSVDLAEVAERAASRVRRRAVGVTVELDVEPWEMVGESAALERAVINLLDNAAKYSPRGGTIRVTLHDGVLTVDDEGPGIDPADRARVFDRFWRAEESRTMPGSGLGLSIVRQVAERHAGSVAAEEAPGGGARLVLRLPGEVGVS